jgi:hypothetical protein
VANDLVEMDYREHERTYAGFIRLSKFVGLAVIGVLVLMAIFLL